jgi:hypothetical protein
MSGETAKIIIWGRDDKEKVLRSMSYSLLIEMYYLFRQEQGQERELKCKPTMNGYLM